MCSKTNVAGCKVHVLKKMVLFSNELSRFTESFNQVRKAKCLFFVMNTIAEGNCLLNSRGIIYKYDEKSFVIECYNIVTVCGAV